MGSKQHTSFNRLPQQEKLSRELLIRVLKNTTEANSHPRLKTYQTYKGKHDIPSISSAPDWVYIALFETCVCGRLAKKNVDTAAAAQWMGHSK